MGVRQPARMVFQEALVAKKLYVGNLPYGISSTDLERVFQDHGTVESAQVIMDRDTGRSKGFGFVEMGSDQEAQQAIQALNGQDFNGRALTVNEARPREERPAGAGNGGRREFGGDRAKSGFGASKRW
jgi:cold-inducible RNA-binding protein